MKHRRKILPPKWATRLLEWYCRPELLEDLEGDLNEYFQRNLESKTAFAAKVIYTIDVIKFCRPYTIRKPQPEKTMNNLMIFQNYFKTSWRNIRRNGLFSTINIAGLGVSMCVGLLLIALLTELKSFDNFHEHADRIYRVNNILRWPDGGANNFATTSVLTAAKIKESVPGVEDVCAVQRSFDRDVRNQEKVIPLRGFWVEASFLRIFSFRTVSGNAATALTEPNSIVLTESAAKKLFGKDGATGKSVLIDSVNYSITAVIEDPPLNSHIRFEMLASFSTLEAHKVASQDRDWMKWGNMWSTYVYILVPPEHNPETVEKNLARISAQENATLENNTIDLYLEPLRQIVLTRNMSNSIGPTVDRSGIVVLVVLALVVLISACFNYTNLSVARALRRTREIGIRKAVGASRRQVFYQFIFESVMLAMLALVVALGLFALVRTEFVQMNEAFRQMVTLKLTPLTTMFFVVFACIVGVLAGLAPASFFSGINTASVLKDISSVKLFRHVNFRKALIVVQYTLSILFIVAVSIGYRQYRYSLAFDLGFATNNILAIHLQENNPGPVVKALSELPEVKQISMANHVSSIGTNASGYARFKDPGDSAIIYFNFVDEEYIALHEHRIIAGENFVRPSSENSAEPGVIINRHAAKWMGFQNPHQAIGEQLIIDGVKLNVIGVVEDFHHERVNYPIQNFAFRYAPAHFRMLNVKIESTDMLATMDKIRAIWKQLDATHPLEARFYHEYIQEAYDKLSWIVKTVGFVAFLAISIASLGLLGMVIFTAETRLKEISIRKVLGATEANLVFMMGRGFIKLLIIASVIAIPIGYLFMDRLVLATIAYRAPIRFIDVFLGSFAVMAIAIVMIGTHTMRAAKANPAEVLKKE